MKKKNILLTYSLAIMVLFLTLTNSCMKDEPKVPVLTTSSISEITSTAAISGGNITSDGGSQVKYFGVCWSTDTTPTINDSKTIDGGGSGSFTSEITGLNPNTTYFVCAYATNIIGTAYGRVMSFTTLPGGGAGSVTDINGNVYNTITIGTQQWMIENLKVTKYRNGKPIYNCINGMAWCNLTNAAYCVYEDTASNCTTYGRLYNWYAVNDSYNLAPDGWHVSTDAEWKILINYLGGENVAGGKLKEMGFTHWVDPNRGATNESGFTALPAGYRGDNGWFEDKRSRGIWWTSTEHGISDAYYMSVVSITSDVHWSTSIKKSGYSVRCVKDK